jgi:hypothetical protein
MARRWLQYDEQVRKACPNSTPPVSEELSIETVTNPPDVVRSSITELQKGLAMLTTPVSELRQLMIAGVIILAVLIYFHLRY